MNAAKEQAIGAQRLPELRDAEAAAAAAFQRLSIARAQLEEEAGRIRARQAELDKRIAQLDADIAREQQMLRDNADILQRLADEEADACRPRMRRPPAARTGCSAAVAEATAVLAASEAALAKLTAERAEAAAARTSSSACCATASSAATGWRGRSPRSSARPTISPRRIAALADPAEKRALVEEAASAVAAAEQAATCRRRGRRGAAAGRGRAARAAAGGEGRAGAHRDRGAHAGQDPAMPRAATCSRRCSSRSRSSAATRRRSAPRSAKISTLPLDRSAPAHWGGSEPQPGDPRSAAEASCRWPASCRRRPQLARRLAQIGIVDAGRCRAAARTAGARPAAGQPRRRAVALGRVGGRRRCADRRRAAAGAEEPPRRARRRSRRRDAKRARRRSRRWPTPSARCASEHGGRARCRARPGATRSIGSTRRATRWHKAEKAAGELSTRRAALDESLSRARRSACRSGRRRRRGRARPATRRPTCPELQAALRRLGRRVQRDRATLADARARHDGLKREAEQRTRRLAAIAAERASWIARGENADRQIASLDERRDDAGSRARRRSQTRPTRSRRGAARCCRSCRRPRPCARPPPTGCSRPRTSRPSCDKAAVAAIQSLSEARENARPRRRAADRRRRAAPRGRGAHPGSAEHAAASGDPPRPGWSPTTRCPMSPMSSAGSSG